MNGRRYTQAQITTAFTDAAKSATEANVLEHHWDSFVLGFVSARLGVKVPRPSAAGVR